MKRITSFYTFITMLMVHLVSTGAFAETAQQKGLRIATAASNVERGYNDIKVSGEMTLKSKGGQIGKRRFDFKTVAMNPKDNTRSLLIFRWPGDIRNTALLTHAYSKRNDDQWLYLPALTKTRRISSSGRSGAFVGSEFAYEDMVDQGVENYTYLWITDQACPTSGECHVIDRVPKTSSGYSRQRVWLDMAKLRIQQVQYFDRRQAHLKTLQITGYKLYQGRYWRASKMNMQNHLTKKSTLLTWDDYQFDTGVNPNKFTVNALKRIR